MAIANTIAKFMQSGSPVFGGPPAVTLAAGGNTGLFAQAVGIVVNNATVTTTFNTFPGSGFVRTGIIRVKTTSINGATTAIQWKVTGTDGVTTQQLIPLTPATTVAGQGIDNNAEFFSDLNLTSITVSITDTTNTATFDCEIAATP